MDAERDAACYDADAADWEREAAYWLAHPDAIGAAQCHATCSAIAAKLRGTAALHRATRRPALSLVRSRS